MSRSLIIVESPAKARTIGKYLNNMYEIKASMGHIRDLPVNEFGVDVANGFQPKYVLDARKKKVISELKTAAGKADSIFLASDHDREGEAIAWHLVEVLKNEIKDKPVHRIIFNEITRSAILKAMEEPGDIDINKVDSQQARRILDRIVGYNISPLLWKIIAKNLSAGRVQSVALRIICEREDEISKFIPREFWNIEAVLFRDQLIPFKAVLQKWNYKKVNISNKVGADEILEHLKNKEFILSKITASTKNIQPSPPFTTSTLEQEADRLLKFSAKKTMQIAQQLYEGIDLGGETVGLITYMRTDSLRISREALASCRQLVTDRFGKDKLNPTTRIYKNKVKAQDAHEAIRPTNPFNTPEKVASHLSKDQLRLYTLIWQKFVATQMINLQLKSKNLEITIGQGVFNAEGSTIAEKGFLEVYPHTKVVLGEIIDEHYQTGDRLECRKCEAFQKFTTPPSRYSEASLIKELDILGIGRPSTYATITNTIQTRKYVQMKDRKFYPTELGITVNKFLVANFENFFNVKFTAEMEESLDQIEFGNTDRLNLLENYYEAVNESIRKIDLKDAKKSVVENTEIKCDKCGQPMQIKWGKNGQFLACSNFPKCKNIKNFDRLENGDIRIVEPEKLTEKCPDCGGILMLRQGRYGKFISCSNYPKCKFLKPLSLGIKCPACREGEITEKRSKKGRTFYSCNKYPECKFISNYKPVDMSCPECGNHYLEIRKSKSREEFKKCPQCGKEVF